MGVRMNVVDDTKLVENKVAEIIINLRLFCNTKLNKNSKKGNSLPDIFLVKVEVDFIYTKMIDEKVVKDEKNENVDRFLENVTIEGMDKVVNLVNRNLHLDEQRRTNLGSSETNVVARGFYLIHFDVVVDSTVLYSVNLDEEEKIDHIKVVEKIGDF